MMNKILIALVVASAVLTVVAVIFAIKVFSGSPSAFDTIIPIIAVMAAVAALVYTGLMYLNRKPPS